MRKGIASPDYNDGKVLTIPVKTRTPLEALKMLNAGNAIDQMAGYYSKSGVLEKDFYMMDNIDKLHALAGYRELMVHHKADFESQLQAAQAAQVVTKSMNNNEETKGE